MDGNTGTFTISLDTELAWGMFDKGGVEAYEDAYRRTPAVIDRLCELFDEYEIPATWAIVSHLLEDCGGNHSERSSPEFEWVDNWFEELPCSIGLDRDLWYAPWLVERLKSCKTEQEIGLHSATHMPWGADGCSRRTAEEELGSAVETLHDHGVEPESFVFPRNDIGHADVLPEYGIRTYRGVDARWYEWSSVPAPLRPPLRFLEEVTQRTPPAVLPKVRDGLVELPGSQVFRPDNGGWQYTPSRSSVDRANRGLREAARTGGVFHLWFHPFNLGHEPSTDLRRFEQILETARQLRDNGDINCRSMGDVASMAEDGHWA